MAAIDFPDSPTVSQLFTVGDTTWEWTGTLWKGLGTVIAPATLAPIDSPVFTGTVTGVPAEPDTDANAAKNFGYVGMPQVILASGDLTLSKAHAGKHIYVTGASQTITIPSDGSVPLEIGTTVVIVNGNVTSSIAITSDTLILAGGGTGTRSLSTYGVATVLKVASTTWIISGNGLT